MTFLSLTVNKSDMQKGPNVPSILKWAFQMFLKCAVFLTYQETKLLRKQYGHLYIEAVLFGSSAS